VTNENRDEPIGAQRNRPMVVVLLYQNDMQNFMEFAREFGG